ncbi:MAG: hypothetical protein J6C06_05325, partial [Lachnospiraceae bacterium]|nr:hypothetical protein [Lachnospiraceae bacterium]
MSNKYTEQENTWAAMISNCLITTDQIDWAKQMVRDDLIAQGREDEYDPNYIPTFAEIVKACNAQNPPYDLWFREPTEGEQEFFDNAIDENIDPPLDYANWKIVGIYDDNDNSGFYAVAIETGEYTTNNVENGVIFSVRGTEPTTMEQKYLDLVNTDLNIFNSDVTEQELVMYDFLDNEFATLLEEKGYSNLATTGHSLGGYLSFSAAGHIMVMGEHASEIFMQGTNIDGPGVTEENLEANADTYAKLDPYLTHYHYTYIGGLLTPICSNYVSITGASDVAAYVEDMSPELYDALASILGDEVADDINILYGYYSGHTGKHALASLQFVGGESENAGNFDTSYVENHNYFEVNDLISSCVIKGDTFGLLSNLIVLFTTMQLYYESENYDAGTEFDLWANIVDKAAQIADDNDLIQIFAGGVFKMATDLVNDVMDMSDEYEQLRENIKVQFEEATPTLTKLTKDTIILLGSPTMDVGQWFELVDDVATLSNSLDIAPVVRDGKIVAGQSIDALKDFCVNVVGLKVTIADELGIVDKVTEHTYNVQKGIMDSTATIINNVESWDSAAKYLNTYKLFTLNSESHMKELQNLSTDFKDDTSALYSDYAAYTESTMNWVNTMVKYYVGNNSGVTKEDLQNALVTMNNTTEKLLQDYIALYADSTGIMVEIGSAMKDYITDSFRLVYAWREKELSDIVLTVGNNLYNNLKEVNVADLISDWVITVKGQFNDATEYVYGLTGGIEIRGTDKDDVINGNFGDCTLYGKGGNDTLIGGHGDDRLEGAEGADTFVFNLGDGTDTIYDYEYGMGNIDKIVFGEGIQSSDVVMERNGNNLVVKY